MIKGMKGEMTMITNNKKWKRLIVCILLMNVFFSIGVLKNPVDVAAATMSIDELRIKFPAGKYWNHANKKGASNAVNNQDGYTSTPCPQHGTVGTAAQTCNGFQPGGQQLSWQCMGYAEKLGYDTTGYNPRNNANGWYTYNNVSALDNLKAGDIVRYKTDKHSIFVTSVNGDVVTYTDCNNDGKCIIRWDQKISKSTLRASFTYVRSSPGKLATTPVNNPVGIIDSVSGGTDQIIVNGWSYDADDVSQSISVHVYIGGPAGSSSGECHVIVANAKRTDVNKAYGCGDYHGFSSVITTGKTGSQPVYIYAINVGNGDNVLLGSRTVNINAGNQPIGHVDNLKGGLNSIKISGWAYDKDKVSESIKVHVYIGGPAGSKNVECHIITADVKRTDVNTVYGCGNYHGFDATISTNKKGTQPIYVYGIDVGSNRGNPLLYSGSATIQENYPVSGVTILDDSNTVCGNYCINKVGQSCKLVANVVPSNATNQKVSWSSDDVTIASVDQNGKVTANKIGTTYICVQTEDGDYVDKCLIRVVDGNVIYGDADQNGKITATDLAVMSQAINGQLSLTDAEKVIFDLNGDGVVDATDYSLLNQFILKEITSFPVESLLDKVQVTTLPKVTSYYVGDVIKNDGLVVTAYYRNGLSKNISGYSVKGDTTKLGKQNIIISYSESGVTRNTSYAITVNEIMLTGLKIKKEPDKTSYIEGEKFETTGMVVEASYNNGSLSVISGYKIKVDDALTVEDTMVEVSYEENSVVQKVNQSISVMSTCDAYGHSWNDYEANGNRTHTKTCSVCNESVVENCSYGTTVIEPDCTEEGYTTHDCLFCYDSYDDNYTDAYGHSYNEGVVTLEATCISTGEKTYKCNICGQTKKEKLPADLSNHTGKEVRNIEEATCKSTGYTGDTYCKGCNKIIETGQVVEKLKTHVWDGGVITKQATESSTGIKTYTCTVCGTEKTEVIPLKTGLEESSENKEIGENDKVEDETSSMGDKTPSIEDKKTLAEDEKEKDVYKNLESNSANRLNEKDTSSEGDDSKNVIIENSSTVETSLAAETPVDSKLIDTKSNAVYKVTSVAEKTGTLEYVESLNKKRTRVTIPEKIVTARGTYTITSIAAKAFKNNKKIKAIVISGNVSKVGMQAFYGCKNLKTVVIKSKKLTKKSVGSKAFSNINANATIKVPKSKKKEYKTLLKKRGITGKGQKIKG
jgi:hypothetical protein